MFHNGGYYITNGQGCQEMILKDLNFFKNFD